MISIETLTFGNIRSLVKNALLHTPIDLNIRNIVTQNVTQNFYREILDSRSRVSTSSKNLSINILNNLGLTIDFTAGTLTLTKKRRFTVLIKCVGYIVITLLTIILYHKSRKPKKIYLIFSLAESQIWRDRSLRELHTFFQEKRFGIPADTVILVQARGINLLAKKYKNLSISFDISLTLLSFLSIRQRIQFLSLFFDNLFRYITFIKSTPWALVAAKDLILDFPTQKYMADLGYVIGALTTQSSCLKQSSIFHIAQESDRIQSKMLWYSDNSIPNKNIKGITNSFDQTFFTDLVVKDHFVWSKNHAIYLRSLNVSEVHIVGSILFYSKPSTEKVFSRYDILIFDVSPSSNVQEHFFYSPKRCLSFLESIYDAISLIRQINPDIRVAIKPKRTIGKNFDASYRKFMERNHLATLGIELLDPSSNLYECINSSKVIIGMPYTSPIFVGSELNRPAVFYLDEGGFTAEKHYQGIPIVQNKIELIRFLMKELTSKVYLSNDS